MEKFKNLHSQIQKKEKINQPFKLTDLEGICIMSKSKEIVTTEEAFRRAQDENLWIENFKYEKLIKQFLGRWPSESLKNKTVDSYINQSQIRFSDPANEAAMFFGKDCGYKYDSLCPIIVFLATVLEYQVSLSYDEVINA